MIDVCLIYYKIIYLCLQLFIYCLVISINDTYSTEESTTTLESSAGGLNAKEISGLVIGIVLFIAVIVLLSVMIYKKKKGSNAVDPKVTTNNIIIAILRYICIHSILNLTYLFIYIKEFRYRTNLSTFVLFCV